MNNKVRVIISLIATIIFFTAFVFDKFYKKENFTPYINGIVRPHIRNVKKNVESFSDDTNTFFRKMIRKSGLYY